MTTYKWIRTNLNNNVYKYYFTNSSQNKLSWKDVLELLQDKDPDFFPVFQKALINANSLSFPYCWNCSPVSKNGLDKSFEFVVKKESSLQNNSQNYSAFETYINTSSSQYAVKFLSLSKNPLIYSYTRQRKEFQQHFLFYWQCFNKTTRKFLTKGG